MKPSFRHSLKNLAARHHLLAKSLALGKSLEESAFLSKYTPEQALRLSGDQVFKELIFFYKEAEHDFR